MLYLIWTKHRTESGDRLWHVTTCLEASLATEFNKIFSGWQLCQMVQIHQRFGDYPSSSVAV